MKTFGVSLLLICICIFEFLPNCTQAGETHGTLIVDIEGFSNSKGYAMAAVFGSEKAYKKRSPIIAQARVEVTNQKALAIFNDLKYGTYAVAVYHDENANEKMDKTVMGIPKEFYGHSNNVRGSFGPPPFSKVKFEFDRPEKRIKIKVE